MVGQKKTTIRVGGVPEHFNSPWHMAIENGAFAAAGLDVQWTTIDTGTGAMCKALANNEIDIAVALTEGVVADIAKGGQHKILGVYIASPLTWGVHVASESKFEGVESLKKGTFGISRHGSGSHLMACVQAEKLNWNPTADLNFTVVGNIEGARGALAKGEADAFMWEKFTTKPHVDSGEWRRTGECVTPWPCFVMSATNEFMRANSKASRVPCQPPSPELTQPSSTGLQSDARGHQLYRSRVSGWWCSQHRLCPQEVLWILILTSF